MVHADDRSIITKQSSESIKHFGEILENDICLIAK